LSLGGEALKKRPVCASLLNLTIVFSGIALRAQNINDLELTPKETIEQLWAMRSRGELLTAWGWTRACGLSTKPVAAPDNKIILIRSNYYGVIHSSVESNSAKVDREFTDSGQIDSMLRYSPPKPTKFHATVIEYHLVVVPRRMVMYGPDGKTKSEEKVIPGTRVWQIEGSPERPRTTVNTAVRYVLKQKDRATDPAAIRNADKTLKILEKLH
jgi:hypothetical protein